MTTGGNWAAPAHDDAGNMTTIPMPNTPTAGFTATYDAWNRLVELKDGETTVATYGYDGLNQRIVKEIYSGGDVAETRYFYYNDRWQCVEEYVTPAGSANRIAARYFWGLRYVDELTKRERDSNGDGTLDEVLYAMQDANFNVVALAATNGDVVERFTYDAYGKVSVRDGSTFALKGDGDYDNSAHAWEYLYTGRRLDRESGLMYYRNRYYHVGLGRFVTRDPIGYSAGPWGSPPQGLDPEELRSSMLMAATGSIDVRMPAWASLPYSYARWNLYEYTVGTPLIAVDPSGLLEIKVCGYVIYVHPTDADPKPSKPHGHIDAPRSPLKLDVNTGEIYHNTRPTGRKIGKKALETVRTRLRNAGLLGAGLVIVLETPGMVQAAEVGGAGGVVSHGGQVLVDGAVALGESTAVGGTVLGGASLAGTTVTAGGVTLTGVAGATTVGGAVILAGAAGYGVGTVIADNVTTPLVESAADKFFEWWYDN